VAKVKPFRLGASLASGAPKPCTRIDSTGITAALGASIWLSHASQNGTMYT